MSSERIIVGADQIRQKYFGAAGRAKAPVSASGDLTPSARYIVVQAKKKIGQRIACAAAAQPDEEELLKLVQNIEVAEGEELSG
ncbi:MAG TPA: hypothetical protein PLP17_05745, partial [Oligoflexia bacterium]|nr:hypothetical protein [Oligoflexia bacterium]